MARVTQQRSGKQNAGTGIVKAAQTAKQRRKQKLVIENGAQGPNASRSVLSFTVEPPRGYTFIPAGNPQLTNALKEAAKRGNHKVMTVSTTPHAARHELSRVVHRVGYHFPTEVVSQVCAYYGIRLDSRGHIIKEHGQDDNMFMRVYQNGELVLNEKVQDQVDINTEAKEIITDLFPRIPDKDMFQIIKTAFQLGDGKVGTAEEIPLVRRAQLSVVAHIRHVYTKYDKLIRQMPYNEARHAVEQDTLKKLVEWGPDNSAQDDAQKRAVEDIFREVIVLSDDEASESEGDDAEQILHNDLKIEELPSEAYAPAPLPPMSPHNGHPRESAPRGYRIIEPATYRVSAREIDFAARDRDRFAKWEQARLQYRSALQKPVPAYERLYEPEMHRIPRDPYVQKVVRHGFSEQAETRRVEVDEAPLFRPQSQTRREQQVEVETRYERIIAPPGYLIPATPLQGRHISPLPYTVPLSRPLTPVSRVHRMSRRTISLDGEDGSIIPSIESPHGSHTLTHDQRYNTSTYVRRYPAHGDNAVKPTSTVEQPLDRRLVDCDDSDFRYLPPQRDTFPFYDPRERSPRRSPVLRVQRQIIEVDPPSGEHGSKYLQYRDSHKVDYSTPRPILVLEDRDRSRYEQQYPHEDRVHTSYTRIVQQRSPSPRGVVVGRFAYPQEPPTGASGEWQRRYVPHAEETRGNMLASESGRIRDGEVHGHNQPTTAERRIMVPLSASEGLTDRRYGIEPEVTYRRY